MTDPTVPEILRATELQIRTADHLADLAGDYADQRPDDDPAPVATCNGRSCGGFAHE